MTQYYCTVLSNPESRQLIIVGDLSSISLVSSLRYPIQDASQDVPHCILLNIIMFYRCPVNLVIGIYSPNIDILTPGTMVQEKDAETPCYFNG